MRDRAPSGATRSHDALTGSWQPSGNALRGGGDIYPGDPQNNIHYSAPASEMVFRLTLRSHLCPRKRPTSPSNSTPRVRQPTGSTLTALSELPSACWPYVGAGQEFTDSMTAANVEFEDFGDPFTVCRCSDATMRADTVLDRLGRMPATSIFSETVRWTLGSTSHVFDFVTSASPLLGTPG
ncbi:hypothetical protein B0H17DRAFT_1206203 [Mycena rosella]|uniref:Uncharacterized protein n=1 Tax=Mycena rosella TaxID=1033263 RepID=A0AAD7D5L0_MYCRO|nr:hypothetical protein B0H17DRAFT_1206203 [Mycena rosella]